MREEYVWSLVIISRCKIPRVKNLIQENQAFVREIRTAATLSHIPTTTAEQKLQLNYHTTTNTPPVLSR